MAANYLEEAVAIRSLFNGWTETPVLDDNEAHDPRGTEDWIRLTILPADVDQIEIGDGAPDEHVGVAVVQVFTRADTLTGRALQLVDAVCVRFRDAAVNGVVFDQVKVRRVGPDGEGWFQMNVESTYTRNTVF
jgi:hypothetical protein